MQFRQLLFCLPLLLGGKPFAGAATAEPDPPLQSVAADIGSLHGSLVLKSMPMSPIVGRKITTWVYLPPGYDAGAKRYPVIYLLHGQPGGWPDWYRSAHLAATVDAMISAGQMQPVILVAFDGDGPNGSKDMTYFCNRATDGYRAEDFIVQELVPYIDTTYRTLPRAEQRALLGYSAGGFGALNLGFKHPSLFGVLCAHAPVCSPHSEPKAMAAILGPEGPLWAANDPTLLVKTLPPNASLHVYMDASPNEEDFDQFSGLATDLKAQNIECLTAAYPKAHAWKVVAEHCRQSLLFTDKCFAKDAAAVPSAASPALASSPHSRSNSSKVRLAGGKV